MCDLGHQFCVRDGEAALHTLTGRWPLSLPGCATPLQAGLNRRGGIRSSRSLELRPDVGLKPGIC